MPVKDGLLVRLRISGGIVAAAIMRGIAQAGRDHGNGLFDLSAAAIYKSGGSARAPCRADRNTRRVGLIDEDVATEAVSQRSGEPFGWAQWAERAGDAAKALEAMLAANKALHALPPKFSFLVDDGSGLSLGSIQPISVSIGQKARNLSLSGLEETQTRQFFWDTAGETLSRYCVAACDDFPETRIINGRAPTPDAEPYRELRGECDCRRGRTVPRRASKAQHYRRPLSDWLDTLP